ncbi:hypothetical protein SNEBB_002473 [Seison nebaliae]|nr:hypothetical protein SNEBB_002473 [Seison nebaliae]
MNYFRSDTFLTVSEIMTTRYSDNPTLSSENSTPVKRSRESQRSDDFVYEMDSEESDNEADEDNEWFSETSTVDSDENEDEIDNDVSEHSFSPQFRGQPCVCHLIDLVVREFFNKNSTAEFKEIKIFLKNIKLSSAQEEIRRMTVSETKMGQKFWELLTFSENQII